LDTREDERRSKAKHGYGLMTKKKLTVGDRAPSFSYKFEDKKVVSLKDYLGSKVLVYFYPRDNTPGCTKQACSLRDSKKDFENLGIEILGISKDSEKSHMNFESKHQLNFTLIPDTEKKIISLYGVLNDSGSAQRVSFLIDEKGKIINIWNKVDTKEHGKEILDFVNT